MRNRVIAGNWKMNKTLAEAEAFMESVVNDIRLDQHTEAIVCAPFPYLSNMVQIAENSGIKVAAQTMHEEASGAFTGEVSPIMLRDIGVSHVIIGHSERREYFNETDETVNKKVIAAFDHGLAPIVCVGETLAQREANDTNKVVGHQVEQALRGLSRDQVGKTIIAYEPIWAIGTGKTASSEQANEVCAFIRETVARLTTDETAEKVVIQYGGSVKPGNIKELLTQRDIDGALVGGASLEASSFLQLVEAGLQHE
ncbi:triose-phosphate isomerase [Virgibacillus sp. W0181]|uniref:triose-phosphate isomerase n=1 Tax=Virgibacillus sp. W0181 TaxID=3391581 RepID=UPI003F460BD5